MHIRFLWVGTATHFLFLLLFLPQLTVVVLDLVSKLTVILGLLKALGASGIVIRPVPDLFDSFLQAAAALDSA